MAGEWGATGSGGVAEKTPGGRFSPRAGEGFDPEEGEDLIHRFNALGDSPLPGRGPGTEAPSQAGQDGQ